MVEIVPAQVFSSHLMAAFAELGISQVFLAPGSRSQSLAIAASQLHDAGQITLRVRIDERSMGFAALGASKATGRPVAIITTSGTAVANLHPAVLEAHHSGVQLILLTADRPAELRGRGANQTTNQVGIFADAVRECIDVPAPTGQVDTTKVRALAERAYFVATGGNANSPGPVQLNLCFIEPLSSTSPNASEITTGATQIEQVTKLPKFAVLDSTKKTVVVAGSDSGLEALELAEAFGWPIFAEPSSRARVGSNSIDRYLHLLKANHELVQSIERVVVLGKPTLSREIQKLISRKDISLIVIKSQTMGDFDPFGNASEIVDEVSLDGEVDQTWLASWREASHKIAEQSPAEDKLDRRNVVEAVYRASEFDDAIVLGASRMIREADLWAPSKAIQVFANRGLSGIDGTIATASGIALNSEGAFTRVILGDLAALHDANSMLEDSEEDFNLQLIIVNDGGGSIFENLEVANLVDEETFDRVFRTPQRIDFWSLANAYGFSYVAPSSLAELDKALEKTGRVLIEIKL